MAGRRSNMNQQVSRSYIAILTGSAALVAALIGFFLNMAWYIELPLAIVAGLLVGLLLTTVVEAA
jgi:hypothetical protein